MEELDEAGLLVELAELDPESFADEVDEAIRASFGDELADSRGALLDDAESRGALLDDELDRLFAEERRTSFGDGVAELRGALLDDELDELRGVLLSGREASSATLAPIGSEGGLLAAT